MRLRMILQGNDSWWKSSICVAAVYTLPFEHSRDTRISLPVDSTQFISISNILDRINCQETKINIHKHFEKSILVMIDLTNHPLD